MNVERERLGLVTIIAVALLTIAVILYLNR
jgi:hypothetical protein